MKKLAGLTLIEVLLVATIVAVLAGGGLAAYLDFNNRQILDSTTDELKNNLRQARGWAMAGRKMGDCQGDLIGYSFDIPYFFDIHYFESRFGFFFRDRGFLDFLDRDDKSYTISINCSESSLLPVKTFIYNNRVSIEAGGSNPFSFNALTGETGVPLFTITLNLGTRSRTLTVNSNGEIN